MGRYSYTNFLKLIILIFLLSGLEFIYGCAVNPLIKAVKINDISETMKLLSKDNFVDVQDGVGMTPLHWSSINGEVEITKILLNHGADVNLKSKSNGDSLIYAAFSGGALLWLTVSISLRVRPPGATIVARVQTSNNGSGSTMIQLIA